MEFAGFLESCSDDDVISYGKNYLSVHFKLDYVTASGDVSNYYPDFFVKLPGNRVIIVETKGREELELPHKMRRLKQWCEDVNDAQSNVKFDFVYVDQESYEKYRPGTFKQMMEGFREYK